MAEFVDSGRSNGSPHWVQLIVLDIIPFQDNTFAEAYLPLNMRDVRT